MVVLTDLPIELLEAILTLCDPVDVARVAQTNRLFRDLVYFPKDASLWRELHLSQPLDDPRECYTHDGYKRSTPVNWRESLQSVVRARNVVKDIGLLKRKEMGDVIKTLLDLLSNLPPLRTYDRDERAKNVTFAMKRVGKLKELIDFLEEKRDLSMEERQNLARLHVYLGLTNADLRRKTRVNSRAFVYRTKHYGPHNDYGPFDGTGRVNWEHMRALHHVVSMHLVDMKILDDFQFSAGRMSVEHVQLQVPRSISSLAEERDWANISGVWDISFCFCDHRDLMRFNEMSAYHLDTTLFEHPHFAEVFRTLRVTISVDSVEADRRHPDRPILHFSGDMENPSTSSMTGRVRMTPDNQIQWHFVSGDQGNAIWSCDGVQVGGVRSLYGILGAWTTIFHDVDDPVGPFWLRKPADNALRV